MIEFDIALGDCVHFETTLFVESKNRDEALLELVNAFKENEYIKDKDAFFQAVLQREKMVSTGIGMGIAIPHAKLTEFTDFVIGIGIVRGEGISWDAIDKLPIHLIFLIGGPIFAHKEYLRLLSKLTTLLKDEKMRSSLLSCRKREDVVKIFKTC